MKISPIKCKKIEQHSALYCSTVLVASANISDSKKNTKSVSWNDLNKKSDSIKNELIGTSRIKSVNVETPVFSDKRVYILSGSSGVGKDTVLRSFMQQHPDYVLSVSCTTRPIRDGETNGKDYFFLSDEEFDNSIKNGEFLEWAEFSGNKYGTKKNLLENILNENKKVILKLDTIGALKVKKYIPNAQLIFLAPPSIEELEARLRGRNTESENDIQKRMSVIKEEMENSKQFDYIIVNDKVENAVSKLEEIIC